jgi:hypothetical protein
MSEPAAVPLAPVGRQGRNALGLHPCVGYFDHADAPAAYDPGWGVTPCLICWKPLGGAEGPNEGGDIRTIGVLHGGDSLSLFYRVHISCAQAEPDPTVAIDGSVMHGPRGAYAQDLLPENLGDAE